MVIGNGEGESSAGRPIGAFPRPTARRVPRRLPPPPGTLTGNEAPPPLPDTPAAGEGALRRQLQTQAMRHEAELALLRREVLEARKAATLGELLGTTTHEFNNALTTILNYAKLGLRHRDAPTRDKALERILSAGTRAAKITASILGMARRGTTRMEPVQLETLIEESLVLLEREMSKYRVQVEREYSPVPQVSANPGQVQQVLLNLLVNARQAMPQGGRLIIPSPGIRRWDLSISWCGTPAVAWRPTSCGGCSSPISPRRADPTRPARGGTGSGSPPAARSSRPTRDGSVWRAPSARARRSRSAFRSPPRRNVPTADRHGAQVRGGRSPGAWRLRRC